VGRRLISARYEEPSSGPYLQSECSSARRRPRAPRTSAGQGCKGQGLARRDPRHAERLQRSHFVRRRAASKGAAGDARVQERFDAARCALRRGGRVRHPAQRIAARARGRARRSSGARGGPRLLGEHPADEQRGRMVVDICREITHAQARPCRAARGVSRGPIAWRGARPPARPARPLGLSRAVTRPEGGGAEVEDVRVALAPPLERTVALPRALLQRRAADLDRRLKRRGARVRVLSPRRPRQEGISRSALAQARTGIGSLSAARGACSPLRVM
jgi:hypothetical protein